jgi:hypothetical protein
MTLSPPRNLFLSVVKLLLWASAEVVNARTKRDVYRIDFMAINLRYTQDAIPGMDVAWPNVNVMLKIDQHNAIRFH